MSGYSVWIPITVYRSVGDTMWCVMFLSFIVLYFYSFIVLFFYFGPLNTQRALYPTVDSQHHDIVICVYTIERSSHFINLISVVRALKIYSFQPFKMFIVITIFWDGLKVAPAGLELAIFLPQPPECWEHHHVQLFVSNCVTMQCNRSLKLILLSYYFAPFDTKYISDRYLGSPKLLISCPQELWVYICLTSVSKPRFCLTYPWY